MRIYQKLLFLSAVILVVILSSCTKDIDIDQEVLNPDKPVISVTNGLLNRSVTTGDGIALECIKVLFPFSMIDVDQHVYTITSQSEFENLEQDSSFHFIVDFVYPLQITNDQESSIITVNDAETLFSQFAICTPESGWSNAEGFPAYLISSENSCYDLTFPINLKKENGTEVVAKNVEAFNELVASEIYFFQFPLSLKKDDGSTLSIATLDDLFTALVACNSNEIIDTVDWESGFSYIGCYELEFPCNVLLNDGNTKTIVDDKAFGNVILQGKFENFIFPISLKKDDGTSVTANNEDELNQLFDECFNFPDFGAAFLLWQGALVDSTGNQPCYTINFPVTVILTDTDSSMQTSIVVNNLNELNAIVTDNLGLFAELEYPVFINKDNNPQSIIEDKNKLKIILESCD